MASAFFWFLVVSIAATRVLPVAEAVHCYSLAGDPVGDKVPCNSSATGEDGSHSACCSGQNSDACLSTGLCLNSKARILSHTIWATGCTDKTFKDSSCPQYCQGDGYGNEGNYFFRTCDSNQTANSWCCAYDGQPLEDCCKNSFKLDELGTVVAQLSPGSVQTFQPGASTAASEVSSPGTETQSSGGTPTHTSGAETDQTSAGADSASPAGASACPDTSLSGYIAGIAVMASAFLFTLIALVVSLCYIWRSRKRAAMDKMEKMERPGKTSEGATETTVSGVPPSQADWSSYQQAQSPIGTLRNYPAPMGTQRQPEIMGNSISEVYSPDMAGHNLPEMQGMDGSMLASELPAKYP